MSTTSEIKAAPRKCSEFERKILFHTKMWKIIFSRVFKTFFSIVAGASIIALFAMFIFWSLPPFQLAEGTMQFFEVVFFFIRVAIVASIVVTASKVYDRHHYYSHEYA